MLSNIKRAIQTLWQMLYLLAQILGFNNKPEIYDHDQDFASTFVNCKLKAQGGFLYF